MNIISLFDGMSCGQIALNRVGVNIEHYYASEIDSNAIKITQHNYPKTIQLGDITRWRDWDIDYASIDLILAGSPCQGFSLAGKQLAFEDERSKLYFVFEDILFHVRKHNPKVKFLLENVKMKPEYKNFISERLGVMPILINSSLVCAQNRQRLYWTNLGEVELPTDLGVNLVDILEENVDEKYFIKSGRLKWLKNFGEVKDKRGFIAFNPKKAKCLTVRAEPSWNCTYILQWPRGSNPGGIEAINGKSPALPTSSWPANNLLLKQGFVRKLTPVECERLQTVPDNYTNCVADTHRYAMLGNGWTVDVICHILRAYEKDIS